MRYVAFFLTLLAAAAMWSWVANADGDCQRAGSEIYCSNGQVFHRFGNTTYDNKGNLWVQQGRTLYGSNGSAYEEFGNQTYETRENGRQRLGNQLFGKEIDNGTPCHRLGDVALCK